MWLFVHNGGKQWRIRRRRRARRCLVRAQREKSHPQAVHVPSSAFKCCTQPVYSRLCVHDTEEPVACRIKMGLEKHALLKRCSRLHMSMRHIERARIRVLPGCVPGMSTLMRIDMRTFRVCTYQLRERVVSRQIGSTHMKTCFDKLSRQRHGTHRIDAEHRKTHARRDLFTRHTTNSGQD